MATLSLVSTCHVRAASVSSCLLLFGAVACGGSNHTDQSAGAGGNGSGGAGVAAGTSGQMTAGGNLAVGGSMDSGTAESQPCVDTPCVDTMPRPQPLPPPKCPVNEPSAGDPCTDTTLYCGYGDSPAANCRHAYRCTAGSAGASWVADEKVTTAGPCVTPTPEICPATPMPRTPCDASSVRVSCQYPGLVCQCAISSRGPTNWGCLGAPRDQRCPQDLPNVGAGCATNGVECDYALDGCDPTPNQTVYCYQGAWEPGEQLGCAI